MITEFAELEAKPGMAQDFIDGVEKTRPIFLRAPGCHGLHLVRGVQNAQKFVLHVQWESVEHHMALLRDPQAIDVWRANVSPYLAVPPVVWHGETVA